MSPEQQQDISSLVEAFYERGYVILRRFLADEVVRSVRACAEQLVDDVAVTMHAAGKIGDLCQEEPFETRLTRLDDQCPGDRQATFRTQLHMAGMFGLFFDKRLLDLAEALLGPELRLYPNYSIRPKSPNAEAGLVLWHQDAGYTQFGRHGEDPQAPSASADVLRMVNVWTPIVPATAANGCMQFVPGSHKLGLFHHSWANKYFLIIDDEAIARYEPQAVDIELNPGDVVLFSNMLLHRGLPNRSRTIRWSCDFRYQDATQSTARVDKGHIARSRAKPAAAVQSAEQWAQLRFQ